MVFCRPGGRDDWLQCQVQGPPGPGGRTHPSPIKLSCADQSARPDGSLLYCTDVAGVGWRGEEDLRSCTAIPLLNKYCPVTHLPNNQAPAPRTVKTRKVIRFYKSFSQTLIKIFLSYCDYTAIICPGVAIITLLYSSVCRQFLQAEPAGRHIPSNCLTPVRHSSEKY